LDITERFSFGVNLDDPWRYAGAKEPKSIIFPHLLSLSLTEGRSFEKVEEATIALHHQADPVAESRRAALALADSLEAIGVDFARCWFPWRFFEPSPVPGDALDGLLERGYDEWPMDGLVEALASQGVSIIPVLACGYQRMLPEGLSVDADRQEYLKRANIHARLLVRHYRDRVKAWQIENEPNWWTMHEAGGWRRGASWLEAKGFRDELLKALNSAVHEEDPGAVTIVNLEADREVKDTVGYSGLCDVLGLDFYPNYRAAEPIDASVFRRAEDYARDFGKPVFVAETGYPSGPGVLGYSTDKQAEYVELACTEAHSIDSLTGIGIWRYLDTSWRSFPEQENHFGLIDEKRGPKEAWYRYGQVIKSLG
jgi:hypothetical protein